VHHAKAVTFQLAEGQCPGRCSRPSWIGSAGCVRDAIGLKAVVGQGHRIKIGGLGRMANSAFGGKLNLCGTCSHLCTMFVVYLVVDNKYNVYVR